jgi:aspartyl-tRNA(Asn)/glutamyl-tRNA(Gln) amidotransferase subunit A
MTDLKNINLEECLELLKEKKISSKELVTFYLKEAESNKELNAYISLNSKNAIKSAEESDKRIAKNTIRPLEGVPLAIKDLFCTRDVLTTAASKMLNNFKPTYESTVTQKLWDSGAILLGKTNLDEFAMGSSNETSFYGASINPCSKDKKKYVPGGSSGGSASAVSGNIAIAATGTDTGGSIRQPASYCGIVGLKPTYGRCSRWGIVSFASSLDQAGPMTKTVNDAALMIDIMAGYDEKDSTSADLEKTNFYKNLENRKKLKIGIPKQYRNDQLSKEIVKFWELGIEFFKKNNCEIVEIDLPHTEYALATYYIISSAEASSNLARYDGVRYGLRKNSEDINDLYEKTRSCGFGDEVKRRIMIGTYVLSAGYYDAYYLKAQKVRSKIINDFDQAFEKVDVIFTPTAPSDAFEKGSKIDDPIQMYLNDVFTVPVSLAGLPAISVPIGLSNKKLPLGFQIIGKRFDEDTVLSAAKIIEENANFKKEIK